MKKPLITATVIIVVVILGVTGFYYFSTKQTSTTCLTAGETSRTGTIPAGGSSDRVGECCAGLKEILAGKYPQDYNADCSTTGFSGISYLCSDCGNGNCESWENKCSCPADCQ